jgi:3-hydroxymyristoyl/3-hydroxydecanoyl-(acyl carrier protein) dehydratase
MRSRHWRRTRLAEADVILLPQIEALERASGHVSLSFVVPRTLAYFEGHFPGCPVLPGVVQVGWAIEFARRHIPFTGVFRSLAAVKFMRVVHPDDAVALRLVPDGERRELMFEYRRAGDPCSSGRILFH